LKWEAVDFKWGSIHLHDKTGKKGRVIPLTPYVHSLLERLPLYNKFVFASATSKSGHIAESRFAHNKALAIAGLPLVSLYRLRRSFISLSEWIGAPVGIVAQLAGHKPSGTVEMHYKIYSLDILTFWHDKIEAFILKEANIEITQKVIDQVNILPVKEQ
jgi:integrase